MPRGRRPAGRGTGKQNASLLKQPEVSSFLSTEPFLTTDIHIANNDLRKLGQPASHKKLAQRTGRKAATRRDISSI